MKNKVLLICLSLLISLGVSAQKYTIYIDDFNSEIKIPNKVLSTIRNVVLDGIQQTNRVNIIDAVVLLKPQGVCSGVFLFQSFSDSGT